MRLSSVLFGLGSLTFLFLIGLRLKNLELALISSLLYALSSYHLARAQEIRMYTLFSFLALAEMYLFILLLEQFNWKRLVYFWVISLLCLVTDPLGAFLTLFQNLYLIINYRTQKRFLKNMILAEVVIAILSIPWVLELWKFSVYFQSNWIKYTKTPTLLNPASLPGSIGKSLIMGESLVLLSEHYREIRHLGFLTGMLILGALLYNLFLWLRRKEEARGFISLWYLIPILAMLSAGIFNFKLVFCRYLFFLAPAAYLNLSFLLSDFRPRFRYLSYAFLIGLGIFLLIWYYRYPGNQDWKGAALYLTQEKKTEARILIYPGYAIRTFRYYCPGTTLRAIWGKENLAHAKDDVIEKFLAPYLENKQETWMVIFSNPKGAQEIISYLERHGLVAEEKAFQNVRAIKLK